MSTLDYNIGRTLNAGKAPLFFMYEFGPAGNPMDDVVVTPLSDGNPIPGWSLTISSSDYGTKTATWDSTIIGFVASAGATFSLADFTGGTGSLQAVNGLRFTDSSGAWDPSMVGMIPEPASLGLLVLGWGVACWRRSRRKSN
ncbi:MAG: PEP-CTERM sorting domain-containing protein [Candidatus Pacebacteria bacterium]|nr:PEP-CTERM sorting domain-containing protein [Candidatus Paceibacterota bacterium]